MKDNFSLHSDQYALYRPEYPNNLFEYLKQITANKQHAWNCGTGNGQIAFTLAKTFQHVYATDISQSQIDNALTADNIYYSVQPAEKTNFPQNQFDLVIVAQAIHWFNFNQFYAEVNRTAKPDALLCVTGYGLLEVNHTIDEWILDFYNNVLGKYWDKERKYIDEHYQTIPFPFKEIETPQFVNTKQWTLDQLTGFLNTWSAVKHFMKMNGVNPVEKLYTDLGKYWNRGETKPVNFPLLLRVGEISK